MEILLTGASGFVGVNLGNYLKHSHNIKPLSVRYRSTQEFEFNTDAIIHLAGKAHDLKNVIRPSEYYEANFELTKQIFDAFLKSNASVFIFMSTVKAAADKVTGTLIEEMVSNPKTHYGISKLRAEEYILSQKIPQEKRVYIMRPCMIHGPGNKGNLSLLYQIASKGIPWPLGSFNNKRSFLSIDNLCFVLKELIEDLTIPSGVYQVSDDEPLSTNELIHLLNTSLNKKSIIWNIPVNLIEKGAKLGDYLHLPLNTDRLQKLTESYVVSNSKILLAIGKSLPISSRNGLLKTFQSFKQ